MIFWHTFFQRKYEKIGLISKEIFYHTFFQEKYGKREYISEKEKYQRNFKEDMEKEILAANADNVSNTVAISTSSEALKENCQQLLMTMW